MQRAPRLALLIGVGHLDGSLIRGDEKMSLREACGLALEMTERMDETVCHLRSLKAPSDLLDRALLAEAELQSALERLFAVVPEPRTERSSGIQQRTSELYGFAMDNATVGCIRQVVLLRQAVTETSTDVPEPTLALLRECLRLAERNADLCWSIHHWCVGQLSPQRGRNIRVAQREEVAALLEADEALARDAKWLIQRIEGRTVAA